MSPVPADPLPPARLVIVGATGTARKRTIPALAGSSLCVVVAVHGRDAARVNDVARAHGIPGAYTDLPRMLATEQYDVVYIASPPFLHAEHISLAAATGKAIICEKPLAVSVGQVRDIHQALSKRRQPFMLAHHLRHQQAIVAIRDLLANHAIGDPRAAWLQWGFLLDSASGNAGWKRDSGLGGSNAFYDAGIHLLDLAVHLFGRPNNVMAAGFSGTAADGRQDNVTCLLEYEHLVVTLNASQTLPCPGNDLLVHGSAGRIEARHAIGETSIERLRVVTDASPSVMTFPPVNLYANEVENFVRHYFLHEDAPSGTTLDEAILGMDLLEAIRRSLEERRCVSLPAASPRGPEAAR